MNNKTHYERLKKIIEDYLPEDVATSEIKENSNFITELNINSANLVDIVLDVEDAYGITFENEDMARMETVKDALRILTQKISDKE
ncbi:MULTISPECIES: acyl carrier protein [Arenibacter]|uniref:acyl carrier protein n=1 Tax=Arenibacter TaxID=178469 RepID=UPI000A3A9DE7|nr:MULTISPECIES: phosphopantetheine-binding protein [Arenibacter]